MSKANRQEPEQTGAGNDLDKTDRRGISDKQQLAIDLLLIGTKYQDVAKAVDISREQLWRWRTQDMAFMTTLELRRAEANRESPISSGEASSHSRSTSPQSRSLKATLRWHGTSSGWRLGVSSI
jgi:transposase-like protein